LSLAEREAYYRDSLHVAALFGIREEILPETYDEFERYMSRMLSGNVITVGADARIIADALYSPSLMGGLLRVASAPGVGLLPERLRLEYGFRWGPRQDAWLGRTSRVSRRVRRHVPAVLCANPVATLSQCMRSAGS
jgi:uncharacterized protein (DUF2236 family)